MNSASYPAIYQAIRIEKTESFPLIDWRFFCRLSEPTSEENTNRLFNIHTAAPMQYKLITCNFPEQQQKLIVHGNDRESLKRIS